MGDERRGEKKSGEEIASSKEALNSAARENDDIIMNDKLNYNYNYDDEDEEWDMDLIQQLVRKEEEAVAASKQKQEKNNNNLNMAMPDHNVDSSYHSSISTAINASVFTHPSVKGLVNNSGTHNDFASNNAFPSASQPINSSNRFLEKEIQRLSQQLLFLDQEKLDIIRDRDEKAAQLRKARDSLTEKEAEIECLKKANCANVDSVVTLGNTGVYLKSEAHETLGNVIDSGSNHAKPHKGNIKLKDDALWSRPWKGSPMKRPYTESSTDGDTTDSKAFRKRLEHSDFQHGQAWPLISVKSNGASNDADQNITRDRDGLACLRNLYHELKCFWEMPENGRETNFICKLFANCEEELFMLLQCNQENVYDSSVLNEAHLFETSREHDNRKLNKFSLKLHSVLGRVTYSLKSMEALVETLFEFCTVKDVKSICSALRILKYTLNHYYCLHKVNGRRICSEGRTYHVTSQDFYAYHNQKSREISKSNLDCKTSLDDMHLGSDLFSRLYFKTKKNEDWKTFQHIASRMDLCKSKKRVCSSSNLPENKGICNVIVSLSPVTIFQRLQQILLTYKENSVKLEALSAMNVIIANSNPNSERFVYGPMMFYRTLSEHLRKRAGTAMQLQAVQNLFLLLNCPMLFNLFCGCKSGAQTVSEEPNGIIDTSRIEGTHEWVLQGLSECIVLNCDQRDYKLLRCALHVLSFIAASGNIGIACLLGFTNDCKNASIITQGNITNQAALEKTSDSKGDATSHHDDMEEQNINIPEMLLSLLNTELEIIETGSNEKLKESAALLREAFLLLHSLCANVKYGVAVLVRLTGTKQKRRLCCNVLSRIISWLEGNHSKRTEILHLAHDMVQRILSLLNNT